MLKRGNNMLEDKGRLALNEEGDDEGDGPDKPPPPDPPYTS